MTKRKLFHADDAAGRTHTRTSENRTYTHTVVALPSYERHLKHADRLDKADAKSFAYNQLIATGKDPYPRHHYVVLGQGGYIDGVYRTATEADVAAADARVAGEQEDRVAEAQAQVLGHDAASYQEKCRQQRISHVEALKADGYFAKWQNLGWCGRADLAKKLAAKSTGYAAVEILPAIAH